MADSIQTLEDVTVTGIVTKSRFDSINEPTQSNINNSPVTNITQPTDYNLKDVRLISAGIGDLNLKEYLIELSYFEDIFSDYVSGKLVLSDAVGVLFAGGLNGTEALRLEFAKGTGGNSITQVFRIFSISNRQFDISTNFETYTINFCSEELLLSEKYRLSKSYKNKSIKDIISDISKNILKTNKTCDFDDTKGTYDFIIPNKKILDSINWLTSYALPSKSSLGADMLFYENAQGYHLKSLQSLYGQNPLPFVYEYNPKNATLKNNPNFFSTELYNILKLDVISNFDTLEATTKGTFNNRLITLDTMSRKVNVNGFYYDEYSKSYIKLNESNVLTNNKNHTYVDRFSKSISEDPSKDLDVGMLRLSTTNSAQQKESYIRNVAGSISRDFFIEKHLPYRNSQMQLANYIRIRILVAGNSDLSVGSVISVNIFETKMMSPNDVRKRDTYLSGKYLITAVRHIINATRYTTIVELAKESNINVR